jgi:hypothetical protein
MDEADVIKVLKILEGFVNGNTFNDYIAGKKVKLVILLGTAYDSIKSDFDRRRFRSAVSYMLKKDPIRLSEEEEDKYFQQYEGILYICIDPNFTPRNINTTLETLKELKEFKEKNLLFFEPYKSDPPIFRAGLSTGLEAEEKTFEEEDPMKLYYMIPNYFVFLNYPLTSAYSTGLGNKAANQLEIQEGNITIDTYLASEKCQVKDGTIYKALQDFAMIHTITELYVASAANAHRRDFLQTKNKLYKANRVTKEFGQISQWWIENRYLEDFCEMLSLMRNVADTGKPVYFLTLDRKFPSFSHPSIEYSRYFPEYPNIYHPTFAAFREATGLQSNSQKSYVERVWQERVGYNQSTESFPPVAIPIDKKTTFKKNTLFTEYVPKGGKQTRRIRKRTTRKHKRRV